MWDNINSDREKESRSKSEGELLNEITMTLDKNESTLPEPTVLKRTFTLPRIPLSKRRLKSSENGDSEMKINGSDNEKNNRKVFRRPSIRKFINKIAQHIGTVNGITQTIDNNRVPPVGFQTWSAEDTPGVTGLKNHGNTCFINAVIQCICHTDVLAEYFVLDKYKVDLSRRNKLNSKKYGTKGEVTEQLALLLKALWACQYTPEYTTGFKLIVERHGSQYKGNQQHDALEFLQWLLDKVHEDLNTASKKKYKSIKTSGRPDEVIAAETLENYKRCNNSFIQGIFQAQYRSSLSCARCRTQSNTFDPFQCISVQLPQFHKQSIYVTVVYTSQQPRQVKIGLSLPSGATVTELRDVLESDTSIEKENMLLTEIGDSGFMRTFNDSQSINIISEVDPIYCIETAQLKDSDEDVTSAYVLLCWINVIERDNNEFQRFGSPYTMQISRETHYDDLQKLILKEMAPILHDDILTSSQPSEIFKIRISDPAWNENEPPCYLEPDLEHPLFMEAVDQALALCSEEGGPPHLKLVLEWGEDAKAVIIADDSDQVEEHSSVRILRAQALQGGAPLTLEECLRDYTGAETLTDAWRCPHCQQYQPVVKTLDVWSLPDILIVHFKRFRQQAIRGGNSTKLTTMVDFPVYGFDMSPHLASKRATHVNNMTSSLPESDAILISNNGNVWSPWKRARKVSNCNENMYDLYAVCYHHGTDLETGHYTAACKNSFDNNWYLFDDAKVVNISKDANDVSPLLVNNSAYILFYQRRNGMYVGNSSNNSSAASTSSVGSGNDHWVTRMPKFIVPKTVKQEKTVTVKEEPKKVEIEVEMNKKDEVALRNSQNTLYSSRKSLEIKVSENVRHSPTLSLNLNCFPSENNATKKPPVYTTSVYINSPESDKSSFVKISEKSPVLSTHRVDGVAQDEPDVVLRDRSRNSREENVFLREKDRNSREQEVRDRTSKDQEERSIILREKEAFLATPTPRSSARMESYVTTAAIHRHSDVDKGAYRGHLNWMSPQPLKKVHPSQQSV